MEHLEGGEQARWDTARSQVSFPGASQPGPCPGAREPLLRLPEGLAVPTPARVHACTLGFPAGPWERSYCAQDTCRKPRLLPSLPSTLRLLSPQNEPRGGSGTTESVTLASVSTWTQIPHPTQMSSGPSEMGHTHTHTHADCQPPRATQRYRHPLTMQTHIQTCRHTCRGWLCPAHHADLACWAHMAPPLRSLP